MTTKINIISMLTMISLLATAQSSILTNQEALEVFNTRATAVFLETVSETTSVPEATVIAYVNTLYEIKADPNQTISSALELVMKSQGDQPGSSTNLVYAAEFINGLTANLTEENASELFFTKALSHLSLENQIAIRKYLKRSSVGGLSAEDKKEASNKYHDFIKSVDLLFINPVDAFGISFGDFDVLKTAIGNVSYNQKSDVPMFLNAVTDSGNDIMDAIYLYANWNKKLILPEEVLAHERALDEEANNRLQESSIEPSEKKKGSLFSKIGSGISKGMEIVEKNVRQSDAEELKPAQNEYAGKQASGSEKLLAEIFAFHDVTRESTEKVGLFYGEAAKTISSSNKKNPIRWNNDETYGLSASDETIIRLNQAAVYSIAVWPSEGLKNVFKQAVLYVAAGNVYKVVYELSSDSGLAVEDVIGKYFGKYPNAKRFEVSFDGTALDDFDGFLVEHEGHQLCVSRYGGSDNKIVIMNFTAWSKIVNYLASEYDQIVSSRTKMRDSQKQNSLDSL